MDKQGQNITHIQSDVYIPEYFQEILNLDDPEFEKYVQKNR